ncbi:MAG: hypothetical protein U0736_11965 [Gemmataceae bacterium]
MVEPLADDSPPEIPPSVDGRYHGGRIDQKEVADLGIPDSGRERTGNSGRNWCCTWPAAATGDLADPGEGYQPGLYFEEPADKDRPVRS